jgi:hypothetical protein
MTASLAQVRKAIKDRLQLVDGINTVYGYHTNNPDPPCAIVGWPDQILAGRRMGDGTAWEGAIPVQILVSTADPRGADERLGRFCDPTGSHSLVAALEDDTTLGGVLDGYAIVTRFSDFGIARFAEGGVDYLSCIVTIDVEST